MMNTEVTLTVNGVPIDELETESNNTVIVAETAEQAQTNADIQIARTNLISLAETGQAAVDQLKDIAEQSQHPRAYEVLATLVKNLADVNEKLVNLHRQRIDINEQQKPAEADTAEGNGRGANIGTTADILKLIRGQK